MGPFDPFFADDLEDTPVGSAPVHWADAGGAACALNRGSHWARLAAGVEARCNAWTNMDFARLELDVEVVSLSRPTATEWSGFSALVGAPRLFATILRNRDCEAWTLRLPTGDVAIADPTGAPRRFEAVWDAGAFRLAWDGALVGTWERALARTSSYLDLTMLNSAASDVVLVDNLRLSRATAGGVALSSAGECLMRLRHRPMSPQALGLETAGVDLDFALAHTVTGWHAPALAAFPNGRRVAAVDDYGSVRAFCLGLAGGTGWGGASMSFAGHSRPALCALPERWEVLLLTHYAGSLRLTRGTLTATGVTWNTAGQTTVAASDVGEATPAICALPDGRLYVCYQRLDASLGELASMDDGQTWEAPAA